MKLNFEGDSEIKLYIYIRISAARAGRRSNRSRSEIYGRAKAARMCVCYIEASERAQIAPRSSSRETAQRRKRNSTQPWVQIKCKIKKKKQPEREKNLQRDEGNEGDNIFTCNSSALLASEC